MWRRNAWVSLKERVADLDVLTDALRRIEAGESVIVPTIVSCLLDRGRGPMNELTDRERERLAVIAQVRTSASIGRALCLSPTTVETHISHVFAKAGLRDSAEHVPRVLAGPGLPALGLNFRADPYGAPG